MIEVNIVQVKEGVSRTWGALRLDEDDPQAEPEILQAIDGKALAIVMKAMRRIAAEHAKAWQDFGDPSAPGGGNGGSG